MDNLNTQINSLYPKTNIEKWGRRFAVTATAVGALVLGGNAIIDAVDDTAEPKAPPATVVYRAQKGDTLYNMATRITKDDPRDTVSDLAYQSMAKGQNLREAVDIVNIGEEFSVPVDSPLGREALAEQQKPHDPTLDIDS